MKDGAIERESQETTKKGMELFIPGLPASAVPSSLHTVHPPIDHLATDSRHCTVARAVIGKPTLTRLNLGDRTTTSTDLITRTTQIFFLFLNTTHPFLPDQIKGDVKMKIEPTKNVGLISSSSDFITSRTS